MNVIVDMNKLCRFCFNEVNQDMQDLTEGDQIRCKILLTLNVKIEPLHKPLPTKICKSCSEKVDDIYNFHQKLIESEQLLLQYVQEGKTELEKLYLKIESKIKVKKEKDLTSTDSTANVNNGIEDKVKLETEVNSAESADITYIDVDDVSHDGAVNIDSDSSLHIIHVKEEKYNAETMHPDVVPVNITQFKCLTCFEMFNSQNVLLNHYNTEHHKKVKDQNTEDHFTLILSQDGYSLLFKCSVCSKEYSNKKSVSRHYLLAHVNERPFVCKLCGRTYKTVSEIIRHGRAHNGTRYFCTQQCGYSTVYLGALKEHEKRHNKENSKYKCEKCGKGFQVKTWYEQHQNIHKGLKPFVCDICGVSFHMNRYLTAHRSSVHPQSSSLKRYVCVHCSLPCDSRKALTSHLKEHGIISSILCDLCGKVLSNREQLKLHKKMHFGEKPFSCSICNKPFTKKFNLQLHERTHTGEKTHTCTQCGKFYSQRSTLRRHKCRGITVQSNSSVRNA
ncbi:unnamed protein product [Chilo suppressalis]|uniref:Uncharacterized protein n=1 Tax=Chilo suppressalis TaxID=168631 RepID=A0ABN8BAJ7_CHISP|nr:hypothetical protein evm_006631 [Chilo suppressalis]CAH0403588.1 unnamed protein product [Chilo suppressalis]